jgi:Sigma-70, region 4
MRMAPHVYGAAVAASRDQAAAAEVAEEVLRAAAGEARTVDRGSLVAKAIRLGVRCDPADCFAPMAPDDREAVALARLAGYSVGEIAAALGTGVDDVKARMLRGLRTAQAATAAS